MPHPARFLNQLNEFKDDVFTTPKAKEYIDIASGFHKLFKNDAKIAESLKPATTKNLSQGLATTLSGALKYQWTKFTLGTLYRNAPDRVLGVKLLKALNEATAGAALKYHIKRALERSHSISEFSKQLELSAQKSHFSNNTLKIIEELNNGVKQASEEIKEKARDLEHAITPIKEFGKNYPEFALKPKEALEKLLQEKNGQVAGVAFRDDLGGIDFVWGTPKTKDSNGYGLAHIHILEKREKQYKRLGLTNEQAKERTKELLKQILEVIEKGIKDNDYIGHATIRHNGIEVGLSSQKGNTPLKNHYMITSFETDEKVLRELKTIGTLSNNYRDGINYSTSNLNNPNPTTNALKTQETLSEQANAKKLLKLESEKGIKTEALKKLDFDEITKLIDESPNNGKDIIVIGYDNLTPEIVEYIHKKHAKVGIERLDEDEIRAFNFTYPKNAKAIIDYQGIQHALNKHGINSPSVKFSKQPPITYKDIANYRDIVKNADETIKRDNRIISYKQVNGHFVVVEQINRNKSEFIFKTMFKEKGDYKNAPDYKKNIKEND
ncbi:DUF3519 domain-containing protein [Helicobacter pylori]|nr:DUF3519 domain-containing protein [Helicobacter pylori]